MKVLVRALLYRRDGCHLCELAEAELRRLAIELNADAHASPRARATLRGLGARLLAPTRGGDSASKARATGVRSLVAHSNAASPPGSATVDGARGNSDPAEGTATSTSPSDGDPPGSGGASGVAPEGAQSSPANPSGPATVDGARGNSDSADRATTSASPSVGTHEAQLDGPELELALELIDIDQVGTIALWERYNERIPVLVIGDREYAAPLPRALLERALRDALAAGAARSHGESPLASGATTTAPAPSQHAADEPTHTQDPGAHTPPHDHEHGQAHQEKRHQGSGEGV